MLPCDQQQFKYFLSKNIIPTVDVPVGLKLASMGNAATFTDVLRARHISVQWVSCYGDSSIYYIDGSKMHGYENVFAVKNRFRKHFTHFAVIGILC